MRANLKLLPYQAQGVRFLLDDPFETETPGWLDSGVRITYGQYHKLLADEMGLGKTIQVIGAMNEIDARSAIIVCPASVKIHWARTLAKFANRQYNIFVVDGGKADIPPGVDIIIVNYEILLRDRIFRQIVARGEQAPFEVAVLDEAHYLKGLETQRTRRILGPKSFLHKADYKWALTGTPVLNRPAELYPILYALAPHTIHPFVSWKAFGEKFCDGHRDKLCKKCGDKWPNGAVVCPRCGSKSASEYGFNFDGSSNESELARRLDGFMLRRETDEVLKDLPEIVESIIELNCVPPVTTADAPIATVRRELAMAKLPEACNFVKDMIHNVGKVVVFAYHRNVIEGVAEALASSNPVILYGGMSADQKQDSIDRFINDPGVGVIVAQLVAGGTGVDGLQGVCNHACVIELDWSPGIMDQAIYRLRRIGQRNTVFVYYLAVPDSLDTDMDRVLEKKRNVIEQIIVAKEVNCMPSLEEAIQSLANSIELHAQVMREINGLQANTAAAAAPKGGRGKKETPPDPPVSSAPAAAAAPAPAPAASDEAVRKELGAFIGKGGPEFEQRNRDIVNQQLWPKFGVTSFAELKPEQYDAVVAELVKGPEAFLPATSTPAPSLAGV